ncbi:MULTISPECIES: tyrosine-type recombinase/integrase [unclassified Variovorax]|uniref:tyrosine-type recombinase/integrase n=1 Tax=unclassified Variovorax TaxID=663243 RepID=UPI003F47C18E
MSELDVGRVQSFLEAFLLSLQLGTQSTPPTRVIRWKTAFGFVRWTLLALGSVVDSQEVLQALDRRVQALSQLYGSLRPHRRLPAHVVRTIPTAVLEELWERITPGATTNPFRDEALQWRNLVLFSMLLLLGLRCGELLSAASDAIKSERSRDGLMRHWVNIQFNKYEDDPRSTPASIKTGNSVRQLPISIQMEAMVANYIMNHRGRKDSSYLVLNRYGAPLSTRGLRRVFETLTLSLTPAARRLLRDRTGMEWLSPHDLRHTCAAFRMQHLIGTGTAMPDAMQLMRAFFGWSHESQMPKLYARTAFESKLNSVMDSHFNARVAAMRDLQRKE